MEDRFIEISLLFQDSRSLASSEKQLSGII